MGLDPEMRITLSGWKETEDLFDQVVLAGSRGPAPQQADDPSSQKTRSDGQVDRLDRDILANDAKPMHSGDHTGEQVGIPGERRDALRQLLPQSFRLGLCALGVRLGLLGLALLRLLGLALLRLLLGLLRLPLDFRLCAPPAAIHR